MFITTDQSELLGVEERYIYIYTSSSGMVIVCLKLLQVRTSRYSMGSAAIYLGFCASIIWVGLGTYLTSAARSHARDSQLHEGRLTLGLSSIAVITPCRAFVHLIVLLWILLSYRFREALNYSTKGYCSIYQGSGCYPAGTIWNWKDCYFLLWNVLLGMLFKGN